MLRKIILLLLVVAVTPAIAQQQQIDSLTELLTRVDADQQSGISFRIAQLYANTNTSKSIDFAERALVNPGSPGDKIRILQFLAGMQFRSGNISRATEYYRNAQVIAEETRDEKTKAQIHTALGGTYYITGNLSESLENYIEALRYYENRGDQTNLVSVYTGLANLYSKQNNFSKALEYNLKAVQLYEMSSDRSKALIGYEQVGNMYLRQRNFAKAKEYFTRALRVYAELNNLAGEASTRIQLGNVSAEAGDYDQAIAQYNQALTASRALNMVPLQATSLNGLAHSYEKLRLYDKSIDAAKKASAISKDANLKIELEQAYETLSRLYKITSEPDKATTFESLSREIKDSLYNDSTLKQLADLQLRYENEKKQRQLDVTQKEQEVLESELLRERQFKNSVIAILIFVLLAFVVFVYLFTQNKRIAKSLIRQKKELEFTTSELTRQKEELGQLNRVKDRFFSIISHDLRNNLTTMKLYFDLVGNKDYKPDPDGHEFTRQISSSVENTIDLLENLLVWAQAQIKGVEIKPVKLDVHHLVEGNLGLLGGTAHQKNITLVNEVEPGVYVFADEDMINLVIRNLVSNAIKFTQQGGSVSVSSEFAGSHAVISVTDTGVGISREAIERLFTKNLNPSTLGTANEKGTGLGLLLCKEFVEKNHGTIDVESTEGKGSSFRITLPLPQ